MGLNVPVPEVVQARWKLEKVCWLLDNIEEKVAAEDGEIDYLKPAYGRDCTASEKKKEFLQAAYKYLMEVMVCAQHLSKGDIFISGKGQPLLSLKKMIW